MRSPETAAFLREELAIRLSHRVRDLQELPDGLSEMENVKLVRGWYAESFDELVKYVESDHYNRLKPLLLKLNIVLADRPDSPASAV